MFKSFLGALSISLLLLNTLICFSLILPFATLKLLLPFHAVKGSLYPVFNFLTTAWHRVNMFMFRHVLRVKFTLLNDIEVSQDKSYLILANHLSGVDIFVVLGVLLGRVPFSRFMVKDALKFVPVFGLVWWARDDFFLKRYNSKQVAKNPELKDVDLNYIKNKCLFFKNHPVSVAVFPEGTRNNLSQKPKLDDSLFKHLLPPKAGGVSLLYTGLSEVLEGVIDIDLVYKDEKYDLWSFFKGEMREIKVNFNVLPIDQKLVGSYSNPQIKNAFQGWLNVLWAEKDHRISQFKANNSK